MQKKKHQRYSFIIFIHTTPLACLYFVSILLRLIMQKLNKDSDTFVRVCVSHTECVKKCMFAPF